MAGATIFTSGTNYLSVATVTCNRGHYFNDMSVTRTAVCLENEQWSATVEPCTGEHDYGHSSEAGSFRVFKQHGYMHRNSTCNQVSTASSNMITSYSAPSSNSMP